MKIHITIYKYTNIKNNKSYIGQTIDEERRKREHVKSSKSDSNLKFHNAIRKYGIKSFTYTPLCTCFSKEEANEMEVHFIEKYDSFFSGYNMTTGGDYDFMKKHPFYKEYQKTSKVKISGGKNYNSKPIEYYSTHSSTRGNFKIYCKHQGWDFNNFIEIETDERNASGNKKFYYVYMENSENNIQYKYRDKENYSRNPIVRHAFMTVCKNNNWDFKHFREKDSGLRNSSSAKLFYYEYIGEENIEYGLSYLDTEYYTKNSTFRSTFKRSCRNQGWDFNDFTEVFAEWHIGKDNKRCKKFFYFFKKKDIDSK